MTRRKRRKFTAEFKAETVKLIRESDRSVPVCRRLHHACDFVEQTNFKGAGIPHAKLRFDSTVRWLAGIWVESRERLLHCGEIFPFLARSLPYSTEAILSDLADPAYLAYPPSIFG